MKKRPRQEKVEIIQVDEDPIGQPVESEPRTVVKRRKRVIADDEMEVVDELTDLDLDFDLDTNTVQELGTLSGTEVDIFTGSEQSS